MRKCILQANKKIGDRLSNIPLIILFLITLGIDIVVGGINAAFSFLFFWCALTLLVEKVIFRSSTDKNNGLWNLVYFTYLFAAIVSLLFVSVHRATYGIDFGPHGDDARFFDNIYMFAHGDIPYKFSLYSPLLSIYYRFIDIFYKEVLLLDILPVNWLFSGLTVGMAYKLAVITSCRKWNLWLVFCATALNFRFLDIMVHLYRDIPLMFLLLLSLVLAFRGKYFFAFLLVPISGGIRGGNAVILAVSLIVIYVYSTFSSKSQRIVILAVIFSFGITIFLSFQHEFVRNISTFMPSERKYRTTEKSFVDIVELRKEILLTSHFPQGGIYDLVYRSPAFFVFRPFFTIFLPVSFGDAYKHQKIVIGNRMLGYRNMFNLIGVSAWVSIVLLPLLGPLVLLGVWDGLHGTVRQQAMVIIFLLSLLFVSLISFQMRHSNMFIILTPAIMSFAKQNHLRWIHLLRFLFVFMIVVFNVHRITKGY